MFAFFFERVKNFFNSYPERQIRVYLVTFSRNENRKKIPTGWAACFCYKDNSKIEYLSGNSFVSTQQEARLFALSKVMERIPSGSEVMLLVSGENFLDVPLELLFWENLFDFLRGFYLRGIFEYPELWTRIIEQELRLTCFFCDRQNIAIPSSELRFCESMALQELHNIDMDNIIT